MARPELTVILPCAGEGRRLNLDIPKPLYEVYPGLRLIDLTLLHLKTAQSRGIRFEVVVVTSPRTETVGDYVRLSLQGIPVTACPFNELYREWPGSVYSASPFFGENNMVLLPDSLLELSEDSPFLDNNGVCALQLMTEGLLNNPVHFLVVAETSSRLSTLGALRVEAGTLTLLDDKPRNDWSQFNGFWAAYGFRRDHGAALFGYLDAVVAGRHPPLALNDLGPPGAGYILAYQDLGTWAALEDFRWRFPKGAAFTRDL